MLCDVGRVIETCWSVTQVHCLDLTQRPKHDKPRSSSCRTTKPNSPAVCHPANLRVNRSPQPATAGAHSSRRCSCAKHVPICRPPLRQQQQQPAQACCALLATRPPCSRVYTSNLPSRDNSSHRGSYLRPAVRCSQSPPCSARCAAGRPAAATRGAACGPGAPRGHAGLRTPAGSRRGSPARGP